MNMHELRGRRPDVRSTVREVLTRAITLFILLVVVASISVAQNTGTGGAGNGQDSTQPNTAGSGAGGGTSDTNSNGTTSGTVTPSNAGTTVTTPAGGTTAPVIPVQQVTLLGRPLFVSVRATADVSRGVIKGGMVALAVNRSVASDTPTVRLTSIDENGRLADSSFLVLVNEVVDSTIVITVPKEVRRGLYQVDILMHDSAGAPVALVRPHYLRVESIWMCLGIAAIPLALIGWLLWWLCRLYRPAVNAKRQGFLSLLLLEPENMTYSLSRAQFILWTVVIAGCYVFIFVARGLVESVWAFPPLTGFAWTFIISLGTLLAAQATSSIKGAKGAGELNPSPADLFVHGGVFALERVQQALWTIIASGMFVYVVIKNYAINTQLPDMPDQLLYLMGISSAGYIVGKSIRKAGPVITHTDPMQNSVAGTYSLAIVGDNLSPNALVWIDGSKVDGNATMAVPDDDKPNEFASAITIGFPPAITDTPTWYAKDRDVVVINNDGQRAEWRSVPKLVDVATTPVAAVAGSTAAPAQVQLTITTEYVTEAMTWRITGVTGAGTPKPVRSTTVPNQWTLMIPDNGQTQKFQQITVQDATGHSSTLGWQ